jgi:hypothetical protein
MRGLATLGVAVALVSLATAHPVLAQAGFHHEAHDGLFPTCTGCHSGILSGVADRRFPSNALCAGCHNGQVAPRIEWEGPQHRASNLRYEHAAHPGVVNGAVGCEVCHRLSGRSERMAVGPVAPRSCDTCHTAEHLSDESPCQQCHLPVVEAQALTVRDIALFPIPSSHGVSDFVSRHGASAELVQTQCSVCHAQQSCARCHVNSGTLAPIQALGQDERIAGLVAGKSPGYPTPTDHADAQWLTVHGWVAEDGVGQCANCHAQPSCTACHRGATELPAPILELPNPGKQAAPQGVVVERRAPLGHVADFAERHGGPAAAEQPTCSACHSQGFCSACHEGATSSGFHPVNFMARHGPEGFGQGNDCASCHNTEAFCRDCHRSNGFGDGPIAGVEFHTAETEWLLGHAQAARQELETCASCHKQTDCMQCHSALAGGGINPHGPDFDARGLADANPETCRLCHGTTPIRRD